MTENDRFKPFDTQVEKFLNVPLQRPSIVFSFARTVLQVGCFLRAFTKIVKYTRQATAANFNCTIVKSWNQTVSEAFNDYWIQQGPFVYKPFHRCFRFNLFSRYTRPMVFYLLALRIAEWIISQLMIGPCVSYNQATKRNFRMLKFLKERKITIDIR